MDKDPQFKKQPKSAYTFLTDSDVREISQMGAMAIFAMCLRTPREIPLYMHELWRTDRLEDIYILQKVGGIEIVRDDIINIGAVLIIEGDFSREETERFFFEMASISLKVNDNIPYENDIPEGDLPLLRFEVSDMAKKASEIAGNSNIQSRTQLN